MTDERDIDQKIHDILLKQWDPMGIKDNPRAQNEYDPFIRNISSMLKTSATEEQLFEDLKMIALQNMGEKDSPELDEKTKNAVRELIKIKVQ